MWTVILLRGSKEALTWKHPSRASAMRRAYALADLHSAGCTEMGDGRVVVDASRYYGGAR